MTVIAALSVFLAFLILVFVGLLIIVVVSFSVVFYSHL